MQNKFSIKDLLVLIIALIPVFYLGYVYPSLPETVPIHFDGTGKPNGFGNKTSLIYFTVFFIVISLGTYLLIKFLPSIDPKKTAKFSATAFQKIAFGIVLLMTGLCIIVIYSSIHGGANLGKTVFPLLGLFFTYLGNLMYSIKPNYFVGIRTPWTLEDPNNWRSTHQLGGKLWVIGGILITVLSLSLPTNAGFIAFNATVILLALVPIVYSFIYFKKHQP